MINIIERQSAPAFKKINELKIIEAERSDLKNGIPVYSINAGTQDIIRLEFLFPAGNWQETQKLQALFTNRLLNKGTANRSSVDIANKLDYYGAHVQLSSNTDSGSLILFVLNKHLAKVLPIIKEMLTEATFPSDEIESIRKRLKQKLAENKLRMDFLARNKFEEVLFGSEHPYGYDPNEEEYNNLHAKHVKEFYLAQYMLEDCQILAAGNINSTTFELLEESFGYLKLSNNKIAQNESQDIEINTDPDHKHIIQANNAVQSAIVIGCESISNSNPDYFGLRVLNTVLGGYFGSRLMKNIREDKGYTYGIHSTLRVFQKSSIFSISTEVGINVTKSALNEIYIELARLRDEVVSADELELVQNYMMGSLMSAIDGPFELIKAFKALLIHGLGYDHYFEFIEKVRTINSEQLQGLAVKYLNKDSMHEVIAGSLVSNQTK